MEIVWRRRIVKPVACLVALAMLLVAARMLWVFLTEYRSAAGLIAALVLVAIAIGVLRDRWLARRCAAAVCVLMAFILPLGIFNPFAAGDYMAQGHEPPTVSTTLTCCLHCHRGLPCEYSRWFRTHPQGLLVDSGYFYFRLRRCSFLAGPAPSIPSYIGTWLGHFCDDSGGADRHC